MYLIQLDVFSSDASKKWDSTDRCDPAAGVPKLNGTPADGHLTSAIAMDWDRDGDFDLVLGDHSSVEPRQRLQGHHVLHHRVAARIWVPPTPNTADHPSSASGDAASAFFAHGPR